MKSVKLTSSEISRFKVVTRDLCHENPHQYESIRIKDGRIVFILYNSKKLVYNTNVETYEFLDKFLDKKTYSKDNYNYDNSKDTLHKNTSFLNNYKYIIGSDETGKGEWYGPLVVCASCTSNSDILSLKRIGVRDSKQLTTKQIIKLYKKIEKLNIKNQTIILEPFSYNKLYNKFRKEGKNLNHLLAYLHSKCIRELLDKTNKTDTLVIIDKFDYKKMNEYLNIDNLRVIQESNAERYIPVATSSIIAKYHYEKKLKEIEERYNINLRKTKAKNINRDIIDKVAKTHFKNV